jgi:hypothetical protein
MSSAEPLESPRELRARLAAERAGRPFVVYRDGAGRQCILTLADGVAQLAVGRGERCEVRIERDPEVSRLHAHLQRLGDDWVIADDGLSRNGTFVNQERLLARRRLHDRDLVRCGNTTLVYRDPVDGERAGTIPATGGPPPRLTDRQREVLVSLCRPFRDGDGRALPAGNQAIADELHLSVGAVKRHLRTLFEALSIDAGLAHHHKRMRLAEEAIRAGLVTGGELDRRRG